MVLVVIIIVIITGVCAVGDQSMRGHGAVLVDEGDAGVGRRSEMYAGCAPTQPLTANATQATHTQATHTKAIPAIPLSG